MAQLLWAPLLKNYNICHEIEACSYPNPNPNPNPNPKERFVRLLLLSQATNAESDGIFSALKRIKT